MQVVKDERNSTISHWWYTPGPPVLVHEDYVGFTVENGVVTGVYVQVN